MKKKDTRRSRLTIIYFDMWNCMKEKIYKAGWFEIFLT